jgi:hypothetical protein
MIQREMRFDGSDIVPSRDSARLTGQLADIFKLMRDGKWRTLHDIELATGHPPASISAQLRNLRKERFGAHEVEKRYVIDGLFEYRLLIGR